ncbi:uncharacterized protein P884DRAFT_269523 [Thermothelomyces heterothallicus CBS 202.75]|uniref:uncharacterized protein n=1 Tax=Thermothelomyces heterothallicus CBS 202.75 TaxID=1149848 RepID=UPI0037435766
MGCSSSACGVADQRLHLVIIGGGVAGLSAAIAATIAGHRCTVLEKAAEFREVGAGFQLTPNGTRAAMLRRAGELGACIRPGADVTHINFAAAIVTITAVADGESEVQEEVCGDVVLAADGLWSRSRSLLLREKAATPLPTRGLAYRIVLKLEDLVGDPELAEWVARPQITFWVGPGAHAVGYSLRAGSEFNLVLLCPDNLPAGCSVMGPVGVAV